MGPGYEHAQWSLSTESVSDLRVDGEVAPEGGAADGEGGATAAGEPETPGGGELDVDKYPALLLSTSELLDMTVAEVNRRRCFRMGAEYQAYLTETVGQVLVDEGCYDACIISVMLREEPEKFKAVRDTVGSDVRVPVGYWRQMRRLLGA